MIEALVRRPDRVHHVPLLRTDGPPRTLYRWGLRQLCAREPQVGQRHRGRPHGALWHKASASLKAKSQHGACGVGRRTRLPARGIPHARSSQFIEPPAAHCCTAAVAQRCEMDSRNPGDSCRCASELWGERSRSPQLWRQASGFWSWHRIPTTRRLGRAASFSVSLSAAGRSGWF